MANEEHLAQLKQGWEAWNQWRSENPSIRPELTGANLAEVLATRANRVIHAGINLARADLTNAILTRLSLSDSDFTQADLTGTDLTQVILLRANLSGAKLPGANLTNADAVMANFFRANLSGADLTGANLIDANFTSANLTAANLAEADLRGANLYGALLNDANLAKAVLGKTILANVSLESTHGLSSCNHEGPSALDYATLSKSSGIPQTFLLGSGLPQAFIDFLPSLMGRPFQYYSCFISYSHEDENFARRLHADLQALGIRAWFAPHDLRAGERIQDQLNAAIRAHDKLILILSRESTGSRWVQYEVEKALSIESESQRAVLFPLTLDDALFQIAEPWAEALKQRFVLDFSRWRDEQPYMSALSHLAKALTLTAASEMPEGR
jgi:uncharacterized protein YjbI with pentapeptide repeats